MNVVALVPAHNEARDIAATVAALDAQEPRPYIAVVADNCTDATARIAKIAGANEVLELETNRRRKPGALNTAWGLLGHEADLLVTVDADTLLPRGAVAAWVEEFDREPGLGGSFAKVTPRMPTTGRWAGFLARLQRWDFAHWIDGTINSRNRSTTCIGGQAAAFRREALQDVGARSDRVGPWTYASATEDYELTYRLREAGWATRMSADVRAYTGPMTTVRALWAQRRKWTAGGLADLNRFGVNRLTWRDWAWQTFTGGVVLSRLLMLTGIALIATGRAPSLLGLYALPIFLLMNLRHASRIPHADWKDVAIALTILPLEMWEWLRAGWVTVSWLRFLLGRERDLWNAQAIAEGR